MFEIILEGGVILENKLRELRNEKKLTLPQLSEKLNKAVNLNISPDALSKYERGDREPKLETWEKLAAFFKVSIPYIQGISKINFSTFKEVKLYVRKLLLNSFTNSIDETNQEINDALKEGGLVRPISKGGTYEDDFMDRFSIQFFKSFTLLYAEQKKFNNVQEYLDELKNFYTLYELDLIHSLGIYTDDDLVGFSYMSPEEFNSFVFSRSIEFYASLPIKTYLQKNYKVRDEFLNGLHDYIYNFIHTNKRLKSIDNVQEKSEIINEFEDIEAYAYEKFGASYDEDSEGYRFDNDV